MCAASARILAALPRAAPAQASSRRASLVCSMRLGAGTDPGEGATALAIALLRHLADSGPADAGPHPLR